MTASVPSIDEASAHYRAGRLREAEELCRRILEGSPCHASTLYLLGVIELQRGRAPQAVEFLKQAVRSAPLTASFHADLGTAAKAAGDPGLALASYLEAVRLDPGLAEAHNNAGVVLRERGELEGAEAQYRRALALRPDFAEAHNNLGNLRASQGRVAEAIEAYRRAAALRPQFAASLAAFGDSLSAQGRLAEAEACYRDAARFEPALAQASLGLGRVLRALGRVPEAAAALEQGIASCPGDPELHYRLGIVWRELGKVDRALPCFNRTIQLQPDHFGAYLRLGAELIGVWSLDKALAALEAAQRLRPDVAEVYGNLGVVHLYRGQLRESVENSRRAVELSPGLAAAYSNVLLALNYDCTIGPAALYEEHRRWAERYETPILESRRAGPAPIANPDPGRRLRVGYLSADLGDHPVGRFFAPILESHDRRQVGVYCYMLSTGRDALTDRMQSFCDGWHDVGLRSDEQIAEHVRRDEIDILVDLGGHTRNNRLLVFAHRPAPIQVTFLGYPATTGMRSMDYIVTDPVLDPPGEPWRYSEAPIYLPDGFCPFRPAANAPTVAPLPAARSGFLTFGSVHSFAKLNAAVLDLWCEVLRSVPTSRLLIYRHTLTPAMQEQVLGQFAARGVSAERLLLHRAADVEQGFFGGYARMDVLLDTIPFCGHTTTCESLWMGVPVLTLYGERRAGRMSASVLTQLGLTDWIARTPRQFVERAARAAAEIPRLAELRQGLRRRMLSSPLCDCVSFTRTLEEAYRRLWRERRVAARHTR